MDTKAYPHIINSSGHLVDKNSLICSYINDQMVNLYIGNEPEFLINNLTTTHYHFRFIFFWIDVHLLEFLLYWGISFNLSLCCHFGLIILFTNLHLWPKDSSEQCDNIEDNQIIPGSCLLYNFKERQNIILSTNIFPIGIF